MRNKFTPGPWKVRNERMVKFEYLDGRVVHDGIEIEIMQELTNQHIVSVRKVAQIKEEAFANARLIAKSPTMYEFIQRVAAGQNGELKGDFIANIRREAKELIESINAGEKEEVK